MSHYVDLINLKINIFSIPPFVISLLTLLLGFYVYIGNRKSSQNRAYLYFALSLFMWLLFASILISFSGNNRLSDLASKMVFVGVTFIPVTFYHFVVLFLDLKGQRRIITWFYVIGFVFIVLLFFTNLYISGSYNYFWGKYPKAGIIHSLDVLFFLALYGNALCVLFKRRNMVNYSLYKKIQIKYMLVALFIAGFASVDYIANYGYEVYPFGYIFIFIWFCITTYAILRHKLLDIDVIIKKTLVFGVLFAIVYAVFAFFALLSQMLFERFVTQNRWVSMIPSVLVVTVILRPLEDLLAAVTDRYLFQKKYDYKKLLSVFASEVLTVLELDKLIELTKNKLSEIMKLESCDVILGDASAVSGLKIAITSHGQAIGTLVLGKKRSDDDYTQEDLDVLNPLAKALGIAISNARLFEKLAKAQVEMAQKEKMATIGTLAAGMAHEIRNPITTIRNFADYLPERYDDKDFMSKFDKLIPREIDRVEGIARSLLEFSSTDNAVKGEEFYLDELVKTVISLLEPQYRTSEIKIACDFNKKHIVRGSKIQLQDAIFNIMNYMMAENPKGGSIQIECAEGEKELKIFIRSKDLIVADHIIKDVFEPVSGLYKEKRGFGFNIFVAKQLIEKGGGELTISSSKSAGSEFCVRLWD